MIYVLVCEGHDGKIWEELYLDPAELDMRLEALMFHGTIKDGCVIVREVTWGHA